MKVQNVIIIGAKIFVAGCMFKYAQMWGESRYNQGKLDALKDVQDELNKVKIDFVDNNLVEQEEA